MLCSTVFLVTRTVWKRMNHSCEAEIYSTCQFSSPPAHQSWSGSQLYQQAVWLFTTWNQLGVVFWSPAWEFFVLYPAKGFGGGGGGESGADAQQFIWKLGSSDFPSWKICCLPDMLRCNRLGLEVIRNPPEFPSVFFTPNYWLVLQRKRREMTSFCSPLCNGEIRSIASGLTQIEGEGREPSCFSPICNAGIKAIVSVPAQLGGGKRERSSISPPFCGFTVSLFWWAGRVRIQLPANSPGKHVWQLFKLLYAIQT